MQTYDTQEAFRKALGCAKSTMSRYIDRDDWPLRRLPPWTEGDLKVAQEWRDTLQEDRNHRHRDSGDGVPRYAQDRRYPFIDTNSREHRELSYRLDGFVESYLILPEPICLPIERDIMEGRRTLNQDEQRKLMLALLTLKYLMFDDVNYPGQFAGHDPLDIKARLNNTVHATAEVYRDMVEDIFGRDAAGTRPKWLQWELDNACSVDADGRVEATDSGDDDADAGEPEPTVADYLAAFDAKRRGKAGRRR